MALDIFCMVYPLTHSTDEPFLVSVNQDMTVDDLKKAIKHKKPNTLKDIEGGQLIIYKVSIPNDDELDQKLQCLKLGSDEAIRLRSGEDFSEVFPEGVEDEYLHILAHIPNKCSIPPVDPLGTVTERRLQYAKTFPVPVEAPSSQSIHWNRPPSCAHIIPTMLLHPVFGEFVDDCENHEPTSDDNALVLTLSSAMSQFFPSADERIDAFHYILKSYGLNMPMRSIPDTEYMIDGGLFHEDSPYAILQCQLEIGSDSAEPHAQAISSYVHATKGLLEKGPRTGFPCLLITLFGANIDFSGAIWTERPNVQILTPALSLFYHHSDTRMRKLVARHFGAMKKAIERLKKYYEEEVPPAINDGSSEFPYPRCYKSLEDGSTVQFTYLEAHPERLFFTAQAGTIERQMICIKFVRHYSRASHEVCALAGFAPALQGFEELPGGWIMVVMERITDEYCDLYMFPPPYAHYGDIKDKLNFLHQEGYVHGDIRDTNMLVRRDGSAGFSLVDFDWSGKIGEARYPMSVNREGVWRPKDVGDGLLILADHDIQMLESIQTDPQIK